MPTLTDAEATSARHQTAAPRLRIRNAAAAIEFYKNAFGARELFRFEGHGQIGHAEIVIGNALIMLGEEAIEYGYPGPQTLGGSPVSIELKVENADSAVTRAVAAGARLTSPVRDQFYGERSGTVLDPFGYSWGLSQHTEEMSLEEMQRRFAELEKEQGKGPESGVPSIPPGYHTVTPYLVSEDAQGLIEFVKQTFGAEEKSRAIGSAGGIHCEVRIGDSMLMIGGGGPSLSWKGSAIPNALHVFVDDVDTIYKRAMAAGAESLGEPADHDYGERSGSVKDKHGNHWYIARAKDERHIPEGLHTVNAYLHPLRGEPVIRFLEKGLGATTLEKYASPEGVIHHAKIKLADSVIELGEAHGPYQPMPGMFFLYVPDVDAMFNRALTAGAVSISEPANQSFGVRMGGVKDVFGNQWYIATHLKDGAQ